MRKFSVYLVVILGIMLLLSLSMAQMRVGDVTEEETTDEEADMEELATEDEEEQASELDALAAPVITSCNFGASGDGCVFDVTAIGSGTLLVDTRAVRQRNRWRATIVELGQRPAVSNIGTGSTTAFTGLVTQAVVSGRKYEVFVIHERLTPGTFPAGVEVRFNGPVTVSGPRPCPNCGEPPLSGRYAGASFSLEISDNGSRVVRIVAGVGCGGFPYSFIKDLSPGIAIINQRFSMHDIAIVADRPVHGGRFNARLDIDGVFFNADGFGRTPEQALGGFSFLIGSTRCQVPWVATAVATDADRDGWSDTAERRLGSSPTDLLSTPEHREVPTTAFYGPDPCHDFADNDRDGRIDGADPGCQ